jgi:hypothetical protein
LRQRQQQAIEQPKPDAHSSEFSRVAHQQSLAIAKSPQELDDQLFIDAISDE